MTLPVSGPISLLDLQEEFGGTNPIALNEYYSGGLYVPKGTSGALGAVPAVGALTLKHFAGSAGSILGGAQWAVTATDVDVFAAFIGSRIVEYGGIYTVVYSDDGGHTRITKPVVGIRSSNGLAAEKCNKANDSGSSNRNTLNSTLYARITYAIGSTAYRTIGSTTDGYNWTLHEGLNLPEVDSGTTLVGSVYGYPKIFTDYGPSIRSSRYDLGAWDTVSWMPQRFVHGSWLGGDGIFLGPGSTAGHISASVDGVRNSKPVYDKNGSLMSGTVYVRDAVVHGNTIYATTTSPLGVISSTDGVNFLYRSGTDLFPDFASALCFGSCGPYMLAAYTDVYGACIVKASTDGESWAEVASPASALHSTQSRIEACGSLWVLIANGKSYTCPI